jgi:hypothetical protein
LTLLAASSAQALGVSPMRVSFDGVVTDSLVITDPFGFGTGSGVLDGKTISGSFFYDPDNAPPDSDVDVHQVAHQTTTNGASWYSIPEVYIGGVLVPVAPFDLSVILQQSDTAYVRLKDEVFTGFDVVEYNRGLYQWAGDSNRHELQFDLVVDSIASGDNIINSLELTAPYTVSDFSNLSTFGSSITSARVDGGVTAYNFFADFELTPQTLTVVQVPEPSTALLLALALGVLGSWRASPRSR